MDVSMNGQPYEGGRPMQPFTNSRGKDVHERPWPFDQSATPMGWPLREIREDRRYRTIVSQLTYRDLFTHHNGRLASWSAPFEQAWWTDRWGNDRPASWPWLAVICADLPAGLYCWGWLLAMAPKDVLNRWAAEDERLSSERHAQIHTIVLQYEAAASRPGRWDERRSALNDVDRQYVEQLRSFLRSGMGMVDKAEHL